MINISEEKKSHNNTSYRKYGYDFRRRPGQMLKPVWYMMGDSNRKDAYLHLPDVEDELSSEESSGEAARNETKFVQN